MTITTRTAKGSELTHAELDENMTDFRDGVALQVPKTQGTGLKVDSLGTPDFGWHDINGTPLFDSTDPSSAAMAVYSGTMRQIQVAETKQFTVNFHIPHDYAMGTDLFVHVHWSHTSATLTGGSTTWGFETCYAKGHDQGAFVGSKTVTILQAANTTQYQHMIAEGALSISGGSATQLDTADLEVDGIIFCRVYLDSNDLTDSGVVPDPFIHFIDLHYQSTGVPTKQRAPDFWT